MLTDKYQKNSQSIRKILKRKGSDPFVYDLAIKSVLTDKYQNISDQSEKCENAKDLIHLYRASYKIGADRCAPKHFSSIRKNSKMFRTESICIGFSYKIGADR